jgi:hypothetical protein
MRYSDMRYSDMRYGDMRYGDMRYGYMRCIVSYIPCRWCLYCDDVDTVTIPLAYSTQDWVGYRKG